MALAVMYGIGCGVSGKTKNAASSQSIEKYRIPAMQKMPSMIITTFIRPHRMMWSRLVVKTRRKSVNFTGIEGDFILIFLQKSGY